MVGSGGIDGEGSCALFAIKISKRSCLSCPNWWSSAFQHSQRKPPPRAFHDDLLCQLWTNNRWLSAKRGLTYLENLLLICYWTALFQSTSNCLKSLSIFEILWVPFNIKFNTFDNFNLQAVNIRHWDLDILEGDRGHFPGSWVPQSSNVLKGTPTSCALTSKTSETNARSPAAVPAKSSPLLTSPQTTATSACALAEKLPGHAGTFPLMGDYDHPLMVIFYSTVADSMVYWDYILLVMMFFSQHSHQFYTHSQSYNIYIYI